MKLLWLCNMAPSAVKSQMTGKPASNGLWIDSVLSGILYRKDIQLHILCRYREDLSGQLDNTCSYTTFTEKFPYPYLPTLEDRFSRELAAFKPDVIHIWGTEYGHSLAMVNAAQKAGYLERVVISIQGLCSVIARHYAEGVPFQVQRSYTVRDLLRKDNILQQSKKFALRGELEVNALKKVHHIIGRTHWDEGCTKHIHPEAKYYCCNETLRETFYTDYWNPQSCTKHRIFASGASYPVKGFHYLLTAFAQVLETYPDATLAVPGKSPIARTIKEKLRQSSYQKYLEELLHRYHLENKVEFLGSLSAEQMKAAYLEANVFVLPSTIENSPNSLGEAMLLGVPCVAADVGGVTTMMVHNREGYVYQSTAPYMLAHYIQKVFERKDCAETMGEAARSHAQVTHDPQKNLTDLLAIYQEVSK